jgi:signal transduction histidine kinase
MPQGTDWHLSVAVYSELVLCASQKNRPQVRHSSLITRSDRGASSRSHSDGGGMLTSAPDYRSTTARPNSPSWRLSRLDAAFARITQFHAGASHELRTPIATIRTTAEVILKRPRTVAEYTEPSAPAQSVVESGEFVLARASIWSGPCGCTLGFRRHSPVSKARLSMAEP